MDPEAFRRLLPLEYYSKFAARGVRPDGRSFQSFRGVTVSLGPIGCADASALVRCGGTTVIATCNLRLVELPFGGAVPPSLGDLVSVSVLLPCVASARFRALGGAASTFAPASASLGGMGGGMGGGGGGGGAVSRGQLAYASASGAAAEDPAGLSTWIFECLTRRGGPLSDPSSRCVDGRLLGGDSYAGASSSSSSSSDKAFPKPSNAVSASASSSSASVSEAKGDEDDEEDRSGGGAAGDRSRPRSSLFWHCAIDIVVTSHDGNAPDACLMAASAAVCSCRTPQVSTSDAAFVAALRQQVAALERAPRDRRARPPALPAWPRAPHLRLTRARSVGAAGESREEDRALWIPILAAGEMLVPLQAPQSSAAAPIGFPVPATFVSIGLGAAAVALAERASLSSGPPAAAPASASPVAPPVLVGASRSIIVSDPTTEEEDISSGRLSVCVYVPAEAMLKLVRADSASAASPPTLVRSSLLVSTHQWTGAGLSERDQDDVWTVALERAADFARIFPSLIV